MTPLLGMMASGATGSKQSSYESIASATGSGQATISFTAIPATYKSLQIRAIVRDTINYGSATTIGLNMNINSDTGSNYTLHRLSGNGSAAEARGVTGEGKVNFERSVTTLGVTASVFGAIIIDILDYDSTTKNKTVRAFYGVDANTATTQFQVNNFSSLYLSTSAITRLDFTVDSTFATGTTIALYGIKG